MIQQNNKILENLELKLAQTREQNREKFLEIEKDFDLKYSSFLKNIFKSDILWVKRFVSAYFQLEKIDNSWKSDLEIFKNSLKKSIENIPLSKEKKENLAEKILNLEKNKDFLSEKILDNSDISKDVNFPILEDLEKKWVLQKVDIVDISLAYKQKKNFLESLDWIWKEKKEILKQHFFDLNNTKTSDKVENFKNDFKDEINSSQNLKIYPNLLNFIWKNYTKLRLSNKVETKKERLKRMFKISFLKLYRLKYCGIDINEILKKIENSEDLDSLVNLLIKFFEELRQNPQLQKDYVVLDEVEETEKIISEAEDNKLKSIFTEEKIIKASSVLEEVEKKLTNKDLEKILSDEVDLIWWNLIDRNVWVFAEAIAEKQEQIEEVEEDYLIKKFEELKQEVFELDEEKRKMFLVWDYDKIDELNEKLIEVTKKIEKMKKLLWIADSDEENEEENIITF